MNSFKNDLMEGNIAEYLFTNRYSLHVLTGTTEDIATIKYNTSNDVEQLKEWDVKVTFKSGKSIKFEIKYDKRYSTTKNIAIEYSKVRRGYRIMTGINVSTSDYYVYVVNKDDGKYCYIFNTQQLKKFINKTKNKFEVNVDDNWSWIINLEYLKNKLNPKILKI